MGWEIVSSEISSKQNPTSSRWHVWYLSPDIRARHHLPKEKKINHVSYFIHIFFFFFLSLDCKLDKKVGRKKKKRNLRENGRAPIALRHAGCVSVGGGGHDKRRHCWNSLARGEMTTFWNRNKTQISLACFVGSRRAKRDSKREVKKKRTEEQTNNNLNDDDQPFPVGFFCRMKEDWRYLHFFGIVSVELRIHLRIDVQGETLIFFTSAFLAREQNKKLKTKESNNRTERPATVPVSCCRRCYS